MFLLSHIQHFVTSWTVACQAALSMEFPRQEYWSGLPFPTPGDLPDPGIEPTEHEDVFTHRTSQNMHMCLQRREGLGLQLSQQREGIPAR